MKEIPAKYVRILSDIGVKYDKPDNKRLHVYS